MDTDKHVLDASVSYRLWAVRFGLISTTVAIIANFAPAVTFFIMTGVMPPVADLLKIWLAAAAAFGFAWLVQPVSFFPMTQTAGGFVTFVAGNGAELRVPAGTMAQKVTNAEPGTLKAELMATIGITGSVFVSVTILTVFTFIGNYVMPMMPKFVLNAFLYILPCVFGAIYAELSSKYALLGFLSLVPAFLLSAYGSKVGIPGQLYILVSILVTLVLGRIYFVALVRNK